MGEVVLFSRGQAAAPGQRSVQPLRVSLTHTMERELIAICQEGYSPAGYLRYLLTQDLQARRDSGWSATHGWPEPKDGGS